MDGNPKHACCSVMRMEQKALNTRAGPQGVVKRVFGGVAWGGYSSNSTAWAIQCLGLTEIDR